jgi:hypothetical protein
LIGVAAVVGLAEDLSATFGDGVASEHKAELDARSDIGGLLIGQAGDEFGRSFLAAQPALG